jgi:adenine-specific DNA methylase
MQQHLLHNKPKPDANNLLTNDSLIKWDSKNNPKIINTARKLIFVSHQAPQHPNKNAQQLINEFDTLYQNIQNAEHKLYSLTNRHLDTPQCQLLTQQLNQAIENFLDKMPRVFDPFAGGGAIPLEAARLGCRSFGNDINPVAHIIQKGSLEFPQKYGKPITYSINEFINLYGNDALNQINPQDKIYNNGDLSAIKIQNRLSYDVAFYAKKLLTLAQTDIGHYYPSNPQGNKPIAYYWARVGTCSNPSCQAQVPLLRGFYLCNTPTKKIHIKPIINQNQISFEIHKGEIKEEGWMTRGNLKCPCCGNTTDVKLIKEQSIDGTLQQRLLAVIQDGQNGKEYRLPTADEIDAVQNIPQVERPTEKMQRNSAGGDTFSWGITEWGQMFSPRQLLAMQTLISKLNQLKTELKANESDYAKAIVTYLGILINRVAMNLTSFGLWKSSGEFLSSVFSRQAIPMVFDYPESNPFALVGGGLLNQLDWITRYIESEGDSPFSTQLNNASSGDKSQFADKYLTAVVTDPPYYDAIAYADLSDFFYVWFKRSVGDVYPINFATPQTPKTDECTALKHHHKGSKEAANQHFEDKLLQIFDAIEHQTADIVSIMFAHQSTQAWTTLCNSILGARLNITGSWAMDSEREVRSIALAGAALESSVTVACKPSVKEGFGDYRQVKSAIEATVMHEVELLYKLGFRGPDLLTACFGKAVSEFGRYNTVEKADGTTVSVAELLALARESAFNALLQGFDGDDFTKFYIAWLQLSGFVETDFDDVTKFSRVGLTINVSELFNEHLLIKNGNKQTLATFDERAQLDKKLGEDANSTLIDQAHRAMALYKGANRADLLRYIAAKAQSPASAFWRVLTSLKELLPKGTSDYEQINGLLANKDNLIRESKAPQTPIAEQGKLEL